MGNKTNRQGWRRAARGRRTKPKISFSFCLVWTKVWCCRKPRALFRLSIIIWIREFWLLQQANWWCYCIRFLGQDPLQFCFVYPLRFCQLPLWVIFWRLLSYLQNLSFVNSLGLYTWYNCQMQRGETPFLVREVDLPAIGCQEVDWVLTAEIRSPMKGSAPFFIKRVEFHSFSVLEVRLDILYFCHFLMRLVYQGNRLVSLRSNMQNVKPFYNYYESRDRWNQYLGYSPRIYSPGTSLISQAFPKKWKEMTLFCIFSCFYQISSKRSKMNWGKTFISL